MGQNVVCRVDEIPEGTAKKVTVEGREIAVFNLGDRFAAIFNRCPHEGGELCLGEAAAFPDAHGPGDYFVQKDRVMVRCPWHGWEFDLRTGQSYFDPRKMRVKSFEVRVAKGEDLAEGPYKTEIFEVSVEDDYVVVTV